MVGGQIQRYRDVPSSVGGVPRISPAVTRQIWRSLLFLNPKLDPSANSPPRTPSSAPCCQCLILGKAALPGSFPPLHHSQFHLHSPRPSRIYNVTVRELRRCPLRDHGLPQSRPLLRARRRKCLPLHGSPLRFPGADMTAPQLAALPAQPATPPPGPSDAGSNISSPLSRDGRLLTVLGNRAPYPQDRRHALDTATQWLLLLIVGRTIGAICGMCFPGLGALSRMY